MALASDRIASAFARKSSASFLQSPLEDEEKSKSSKLASNDDALTENTLRKTLEKVCLPSMEADDDPDGAIL